MLQLDGGAGTDASRGGRGGAALLTQFYVRTGVSVDRYLLLYALLKLRLLAPKALLFVNDISAGYKLKLFLERFGISAGVLNAALPANSRAHIIESFNRGAFDLLIATDDGDAGAAAGEVEDEVEEGAVGTDAKGAGSGETASATGAAVKSRKRGRAATAAATATAMSTAPEHFSAARGLDFRGVATVVNFDPPRSASAYVHRIGRTARGGAAGVALTIFPPELR